MTTVVAIGILLVADVALFWMMFRLGKLEAKLFPPEKPDVFEGLT